MKNTPPENTSLSRVRQNMHETSVSLRKKIKEFRTPMLDHGLWLALNDLFDDLNDNYDNVTRFSMMLPQSLVRLDITTEVQLYRIVQGICNSVLDFGEATSVYLTGIISEDEVRLNLIDDGKPIPEEMITDLNAMVIHELYDLARLMFKANYIGARLIIRSLPADEGGVSFSLVWNPAQNPLKPEYQPSEINQKTLSVF